MVQEICRDIKQLDNAKRHLQSTISTLKTLNMLVVAVDQLQESVDRRAYHEAGNLVGAVGKLFEYFHSYQSVPKIAELQNYFDAMKNNLKEQVTVRRATPSANSPT